MILPLARPPGSGHTLCRLRHGPWMQRDDGERDSNRYFTGGPKPTLARIPLSDECRRARTTFPHHRHSFNTSLTKNNNNNNKLSSTQTINCAQQSDGRVCWLHCTGGPGTWQDGRRGEGHGAVARPRWGFTAPPPHVRLVFCFLACLFASSGPLLSDAVWPRARTPCSRLVNCNSKGMSWKERQRVRGRGRPGDFCPMGTGTPPSAHLLPQAPSPPRANGRTSAPREAVRTRDSAETGWPCEQLIARSGGP